MEAHAVGMVEGPHDFYFLNEALLSLVLAVGGFLGESLDCIVATRFDLLGEVHRGEIALTDFLLGLELLVEAPLIEPVLQGLPPALEVLLRLEREHHLVLCLLQED